MDSVASLLAQTIPPYEILIIDDGSDEPIQQFLWNVPVIRVTHRGIGRCRNTGLMLAQGDLFLNLDADDTLDQNFIQECLKVFEAPGKWDAVCVSMQELGLRNDFYPAILPELEEERVHNSIPGCGMFRTQMLREIGGWAEWWTGWDDWGLWLDLLTRKKRIYPATKAIYNYQVRSDSITRGQTV